MSTSTAFQRNSEVTVGKVGCKLMESQGFHHGHDVSRPGWMEVLRSVVLF